ncbi:DUF1254 domain-containing protein [Algiphilus sp.]|uniref:DUF1254 domain-containing protein n=1 Tax=Algiphilus sp. TaxID=1872431 RepID=UPI003C6927AE
MQDIERLAERAYIYAYSPVYAYGLTWRQIVGAPEAERQPVNAWKHFRSLATPTFNNYIPWVNNDTVYSSSWLDLRAEPVVLTTPAMADHRFQNIQINDVWGHNIVNRGTRTHGNGARRYLIAGPDWDGPCPEGIDEVLQGESWLLKLFARILVEGEDEDWDELHRLQDAFALTPLSAWAGTAPPAAPPPVAWIEPDGDPRRFEARHPGFIRYLNFVLGMCRIHPSEHELLASFEPLGIGPDRDFDPAALDAQTRDAIQRGIDSAHSRIMARVTHLDDPINGWVYPLDLRGSREILAGSDDAYFRRAVIARYAIWGPGAEEVVYLTAAEDPTGRPLDGGRRYRMHFDGPVPVHGFWSFSVYDADSRLLIAHPSGRYKIGDRDPVDKAPDGSMTLLLQHEDPGPDKRANWLPVPEGTFHVVGRLYWPGHSLLSGQWQPPGIEAVD